MNTCSGNGSSRTSCSGRDAAAWTEQSPHLFRGTGSALQRDQPRGLAGPAGFTQEREAPMRPQQPGGGVGGSSHPTAAATAHATEG